MRIITPALIAGILIICTGSCAEEKNPSASENLSDFVETITIVKKALEIDRGNIQEYDFLLFVTVADEKKDAINSIDLTFPNGRKLEITREIQTLPGHEQICGFIREDPAEPHAWFYRNIAMPSMDEFSDGLYQFQINHKSGTEEFKIEFKDPETGAAIPVPEFGTILEPEEKEELTSPVSVSVGDHEKTIGLYFGLRDQESGSFLDQRDYEMLPGTNKSEPVDLVPGNWGGELNISEGVSGEINGVSWQIILLATVEFRFKVIE
jgi:hypothetical protein